MDQLTDHDYDGIREYDNPMPGWWVAIFWITIVFAAGYFVWYHAPVEGRSIKDSYEEARVADLKKQFKDIGELKPLDTPGEVLAGWAQNEKFTAIGRAIFKSNCASCHGDNAQGLVGPNLTDGKYKNIRVITDIPRVITNGVNAMPPKGGMPGMSNNEVGVVAAYVISLRGQNVPGPLYPGKVEIPPFPKAAEKK